MKVVFIHTFSESEPGHFLARGQEKEGDTERRRVVEVTVGAILLPWVMVRVVVQSWT